MFKDYYAILEVSEFASNELIRSSFKKQALKWHPDRNPGLDSTIRMQEINEAYLILKDLEARNRYNIEYQRFKIYRADIKAKKAEDERTGHSEQKKSDERTSAPHHNTEQEFKFSDDVLKKWMENARRQAKELAKQTIEDIVGMVAVGTKTAIKEAGSYFLFYMIISFCIIFLILIYKSCS